VNTVPRYRRNPTDPNERSVSFDLHFDHEDVIEANADERFGLKYGDAADRLRGQKDGWLNAAGELTPEGWDQLVQDELIIENNAMRWMRKNFLYARDDGHSNDDLVGEVWFNLNNPKQVSIISVGIYERIDLSDNSYSDFPDQSWNGVSWLGLNVLGGAINFEADEAIKEEIRQVIDRKRVLYTAHGIKGRGEGPYGSYAKKNPKTDPFQVLEAMAKVSWRVLGQCFKPDCCIAATKIGIEALKPFGIAGRPMPTRTAAMNAAYYAWASGAVAQPDPEKARILIIDESCDGGTGFPGHLVIVGKTKSIPFLLDLSVFQLHRPHKGISIPPEGFVVMLPPNFEFKGEWHVPIHGPDGAVIIYSAHPKAPDYTSMPDWMLRTPDHYRRFVEMTQELVAATRAELEK